jgi:hypothetical protein
LDWGGHPRTENDLIVLSVTAHPQESETNDSQVRDCLTPLDNNAFSLHPLPPDSDDSIQDGLHDIPKALLTHIQDNWRKGGLNNRVTA